MKELVGTTLLALGVIIGHFSCRLGQVIKRKGLEKGKKGGFLHE